MAMSFVLLTYVVGRSIPGGGGSRFVFFHCTMEEGTQFVPGTVIVVSGRKSGTLAGEMEASVGTGLFGPAGGGLCQSRASPSFKAGPAPTFQTLPCVEEDKIPVVANWP